MLSKRKSRAQVLKRQTAKSLLKPQRIKSAKARRQFCKWQSRRLKEPRKRQRKKQIRLLRQEQRARLAELTPVLIMLTSKNIIKNMRILLPLLQWAIIRKSKSSIKSRSSTERKSRRECTLIQRRKQSSKGLQEYRSKERSSRLKFRFPMKSQSASLQIFCV